MEKAEDKVYDYYNRKIAQKYAEIANLQREIEWWKQEYHKEVNELGAKEARKKVHVIHD